MRDRTWLAFTTARLVLPASVSPVATSTSVFGAHFVFFWWAPPLSVTVLLVEIFVAALRPPT